MFQINDVIIYGTQGVCRITGTEEKCVSGKKRTYFVLKPVEDKGATIFAPTDNEAVLRKMRRLLTKAEIHQLIDSMERESAPWEENENLRKLFMAMARDIRVIIIKLNIVKQMIRAVANSRPCSNLLFKINNLVCAIS